MTSSASDPYDVIVVGAGLTGALVASRLAEKGKRVVVLEAARTLGGTVRRQPGLALLGTPQPFLQLIEECGEEAAHLIWELTSENLVRLEILLEEMGIASEKTGSLRLAPNPAQSQIFRESADQLATYGYGTTLEDDSRYGDLVAISTTDDLVFSPGDLIEALLDNENISVECDAEVQAVRPRPDGGVAVWAHQHYLWADKVVYANGIYATALEGSLASVLHPACVHTVVFENTQSLVRPLILDNGRVWFVPYREQAYMTGWNETEIDILRKLSPLAEQLCPGARVLARFTTRVAGSDDLLPIVGRLSDESSLYLVDGLGPFGLNLALVAADELVELIESDEPSELFGLERFA